MFYESEVEVALEVGKACGKLGLDVELKGVASRPMSFELNSGHAELNFFGYFMTIEGQEELLCARWIDTMMWRQELWEMLEEYKKGLLRTDIKRNMLPGEAALGVHFVCPTCGEEHDGPTEFCETCVYADKEQNIPYFLG